MTNIEWNVTNGSKQGAINIHLESHTFLSGKPLVKNTFFKSFPKKRSDSLWNSKIRIWIWSEESTQSVDFKNSWPVFGFGNPDLGSQKNAPLHRCNLQVCLLFSDSKTMATLVNYTCKGVRFFGNPNPDFRIQKRVENP